MKTFTSLLVNRLSTFLFTLSFIFFAGMANAHTGNNTIIVINPGIEYASLVATANHNNVFINWVTVSELNNSHFEVERSTDMKSFKTVAIVLDGFSTTGAPGKSYKFKEAAGEISKGKKVYYRLKQIDTNNQIHYSTIMTVQMNVTVTVFFNKESLNTTITSISKDHTNNQTLLSKQSSLGKIKIPVASTAGILTAREIIYGTELYASKLIFA